MPAQGVVQSPARCLPSKEEVHDIFRSTDTHTRYAARPPPSRVDEMM